MNQGTKYGVAGGVAATVCAVIVAATMVVNRAPTTGAAYLNASLTTTSAAVAQPTSTGSLAGDYMPSQYDEEHVPADNADASPTF